MDGTKTRTSGGNTLPSRRTAPLKPKSGLSGPPASEPPSVLGQIGILATHPITIARSCAEACAQVMGTPYLETDVGHPSRPLEGTREVTPETRTRITYLANLLRLTADKTSAVPCDASETLVSHLCHDAFSEALHAERLVRTVFVVPERSVKHVVVTLES